MRAISIVTFSVGLYATYFLMAGCQQHHASIPPVNATSTAHATKKVEIIVETVKPRFKRTVSFEVKPNAQANINMYWDGRNFVSKIDSETHLLNISSFAFDKQQVADFKIEKKVTTTTGGSSATTKISKVVRVRLGVPKNIDGQM